MRATRSSSASSRSTSSPPRYGTQDRAPRPYRFGYGVLDTNLNGTKDPGEKKVYFEFSDYSTPYVFFESPG